jgi:hypothetical protein
VIKIASKYDQTNNQEFRQCITIIIIRILKEDEPWKHNNEVYKIRWNWILFKLNRGSYEPLFAILLKRKLIIDSFPHNNLYKFKKKKIHIYALKKMI